MDFQLAGMLIVTAVAIPYMVEILRQVPLLTRMIAALPAEQRARMGRHPRDPRLGIFGSARFFLRLFRYALRTDPEDSAEMAALKRKARWSAVREGIFGLLLLGTIIVLCWHGWRPPFLADRQTVGPPVRCRDL